MSCADPSRRSGLGGPGRAPRGPCRSTSCSRPAGRSAARTARSPGRRTRRRSRRGTRAGHRSNARAWRRPDSSDSVAGRSADPCWRRTIARRRRRGTPRSNHDRTAFDPGTPWSLVLHRVDPSIDWTGDGIDRRPAGDDGARSAPTAARTVATLTRRIRAESSVGKSGESRCGRVRCTGAPRRRGNRKRGRGVRGAMDRLRLACLALSTGLLIGACTAAGPSPSASPGVTGSPPASPSASPPASPAIEHPSGAADLVLRMSTGGGFIAPGCAADRDPRVLALR